MTRNLDEAAHAICRETRIIDEQAAALLDLATEIEHWCPRAEPDACRARIAIIHARTAAIRERIDQPCPT